MARGRGVRLGNHNGAAALWRAGKGGAPPPTGMPGIWHQVLEVMARQRRDQPAGNRGEAERPRHADPPWGRWQVSTVWDRLELRGARSRG